MKDKEILVNEKKHDFDSLVSLTAALREPGGCPWDREQTHKSVRGCLIEETYEVVEGIDKDDKALLCEELGDLLFQVLFHARIEEEQGNFDIGDVIDGITEKMINRHPHVFGSVKVSGTGEVLDNWDAIKKEEKSLESDADQLRRVPPYLPALMRAQKIQKKAFRKYSYGFSDANAALEFAKDTICEAISDRHIAELGAASHSATDGTFCSETEGDKIAHAVFALCGAAAFSGVDLEEKLTKVSDSFVEKFATEHE